MEHTPGPWRTNADDESRFNRAYVWVWGDDGSVIIRREILDRATDEANARLIAAAPDLLAALEDCLGALELMDGAATPASFRLRETAYNAIRKARGE